MPLLETKGAASAQGFGLTLGGAQPVYVEDVFSTWLYTGNGASKQTFVTGVDLSGKGGMVWIKDRSLGGTNPTTSSYAIRNHYIFDTLRTNTSALCSSAAVAQDTSFGPSYINFLSNGFDNGSGNNWTNELNSNYASWSFRKQPKFFDVVAFTTPSSGAATFNHNLGSVPGCVIMKSTGGTGDWYVYHRSVGSNAYLNLNNINAQSSATSWCSVTSTTVTGPAVGFGMIDPNQTYVAYLFAHNAGGFGLTGTDNVISCGSYTGNGSATGPTVSLGYEPQYLMIKNASATGGWVIVDNMRGMPVGGSDPYLMAQSSAAEDTTFEFVSPTATGFNITTTNTAINGSGNTIIYIAIRRGPMKTPTTGTSVFSPNTSSAASGTKITTNFPVDAQLGSDLVGTSNRVFVDRLRGISTNTTGAGQTLLTNSTNAEATDTGASLFWDNTGFQMNANFGGASAVFWNFRRAPGFFDEVCYTGDGAASLAVSHNLGVKPEIAIIKCRTSGTTTNWIAAFQTGTFIDLYRLNTNDAFLTNVAASNFTSTTFVTGTSALGANETTNTSNGSGNAYVAYLFASCPGVSKVGKYTGNGSSQTINCGFTGGARFVLIKRTDSTGNWTLFDSARGIVAGNDPAIYINSNAAEVTGIDAVDTDSTGFIVNQDATLNLNVSSATYIFLAIA